MGWVGGAFCIWFDYLGKWKVRGLHSSRENYLVLQDKIDVGGSISLSVTFAARFKLFSANADESSEF